MEDITKIVKSIEDSSLSIKSINQTIENETKAEKDMLLGTLGTTLLSNMVAGKGAGKGYGVIRAGEGKIKIRQDF